MQKFEAYGFRFSSRLTEEIRNVARMERQKKIPAPTGDKTYGASHVSAFYEVRRGRTSSHDAYFFLSTDHVKYESFH